jgi:crossover junction endodeoxyribonuclease RusA
VTAASRRRLAALPDPDLLGELADTLTDAEPVPAHLVDASRRGVAQGLAQAAVRVDSCADLASLADSQALAAGAPRPAASPTPPPACVGDSTRVRPKKTVQGEPGTFTIEIPARTKLLNLNDRPNHYARARTVKNLRTIAHQLAVIRRLPHLERVSITGFVHPPDNRDRDPHNWSPTLKAATDGIVDAGVITDDSSQYLIRTEMLLGAKTRFLTFSLLIREET